jgi:hypothetical protein
MRASFAMRRQDTHLRALVKCGIFKGILDFGRAWLRAFADAEAALRFFA